MCCIVINYPTDSCCVRLFDLNRYFWADIREFHYQFVPVQNMDGKSLNFSSIYRGPTAADLTD